MKPERTLKTCNRCGHSWLSRIEPKCCAKCRSPFWNKERVRPVKTNRP